MLSERPLPVLPRSTLIQLYTRFLLNLPNELKEECRRNFVRLLFEVERAHWFYLDHYIEDPSVGGVDMYGFTEQLFRQFPEIVPKGVNWREKFAEWRRYRGETETGSAIILDEYFEMVLLVQGFYGNRWNFPGGKVNENETLIDCAAREVLEETGLDVEYRIVPSLYIDRFIGGALRRAFIIENMPRMSRLQPCTRNEIEAITWFNVHDLPTHAQDNRPMEKFNMRANNFYLLLPFVKQLQEYVKLRLTGLLPLSALEESGRLVDLDRPIVSTVDGPRSGIENITSPKQFRSRGKKPTKLANPHVRLLLQLPVCHAKQLQEYVKLRLTGLLPLSALEESGRLVDLDRPIVSTVDGPRSGIENITSPKQFRSRGKKNHKARQPTRSSASAAASVSCKVTDVKSMKPNIPVTSAVPVDIDLSEFRKDLILLNVPSSTSGISEVDFSASYWNNVRLRGDVLTELLSSP
ncbi:hypothetical protein AHF37_02260 [Paragonimus kellicotti]|nr:hypothetical protein AHF37_02260 [Paragonimus kellicotti]